MKSVDHYFSNNGKRFWPQRVRDEEFKERRSTIFYDSNKYLKIDKKIDDEKKEVKNHV